MIKDFSLAVHVFPFYMLSYLSNDEIFLPRNVNLSTNFRGLPQKSLIAMREEKEESNNQ